MLETLSFLYLKIHSRSGFAGSSLSPKSHPPPPLWFHCIYQSWPKWCGCHRWAQGTRFLVIMNIKKLIFCLLKNCLPGPWSMFIMVRSWGGLVVAAAPATIAAERHRGGFPYPEATLRTLAKIIEVSKDTSCALAGLSRSVDSLASVVMDNHLILDYCVAE